MKLSWLIVTGLVLSAAHLPCEAQARIDLVGLVIDGSARKPVPDVSIELTGTAFRAVSDARGRFRFNGVPGGDYILAAEHVAYERSQTEISLHQTDVDVLVVLNPGAVEVEPIEVVVASRSRWLMSNGFYERREKSGLSGQYITRADIENRNPSSITDLLDDFPGVTVLYAGPGRRTVRFNRLSGNFEPHLYIDGVLYRHSTPAMQTSGRGFVESANRVDDFGVISPAQIEAVEIYVGAATPVRFANAGGCGVVLYWLKR